MKKSKKNPVLLEAERLQVIYTASLKALEDFLNVNDNSRKINLLSLLEMCYKQKKGAFDTSDAILPNILDQNLLLDDQKKQAFYTGAFVPTKMITITDLYGAVVSQVPDFGQWLENAKYYGGYSARTVEIDMTGFALVTYIESEAFLNEFEVLPIEKKMQFAALLSQGLCDSWWGRNYLKKNFHKTLIAGEKKPVIHLSLIEEITTYLDQKTNVEINTQQGKALVDIASNLLSFIFQSLPAILLNDTDNVKIITRKTVILAIETSFKIIKVFDYVEYELVVKVEFISKTDTVVYIDEFESYLNKIRAFILNKKEFFKPQINSDTNEFEIKGFELYFNLLSTVLDIWALDIAVKNFLSDPSLQGSVEVLGTSVSVADNLSKTISKLVRKKSLDIKLLGKTAGVLGMISSGWSAFSAIGDDEDYSVGSGHIISGVGTAILTFETSLIALGLSTSWSGIGLVLVAIGIILIYFTENAETELWFKYNYYGIGWSEVETEYLGGTLRPIDLKFAFVTTVNNLLVPNYERQIVKFNSLIQKPNITATGWIYDPGDTTILQIILTDPALMAKNMHVAVLFWDDTTKKFVWGEDKWFLITNLNLKTMAKHSDVSFDTTEVYLDTLTWNVDDDNDKITAIHSMTFNLRVKDSFKSSTNIDIIEMHFWLFDENVEDAIYLIEAHTVSII